MGAAIDTVIATAILSATPTCIDQQHLSISLLPFFPPHTRALPGFTLTPIQPHPYSHIILGPPLSAAAACLWSSGSDHHLSRAVRLSR